MVVRPLAIAEKIAEKLTESYADAYMSHDVEVVDIYNDELPSYGITVSPETFAYGMGTADRDDVVYGILISRTLHSNGDEDMESRLQFYNNIRLLFHNKRLAISNACHAYCMVDPTKTAIPEAWRKNNNSLITVRVKVLVRESREEEL